MDGIKVAYFVNRISSEESQVAIDVIAFYGCISSVHVLSLLAGHEDSR
jgi:hypothetical protein